jgi:hypothetical protein
MLAQPVFGCAALSQGPHHRVLWLERRLIGHLDGHEPAGARSRNVSVMLTSAVRKQPHSRSSVCHTWYPRAVARITHEYSFFHAPSPTP